MQRKFFIETWGCQMNELDSARLAGQLVSRGWIGSSHPGDAHLVLLNTCSVREKAEEKVYSSLGRILPLKKFRPEVLVGVAGCVAQQEGEGLLRRAPGLDFVLGTGSIDSFGRLVDGLLEQRERVALLEVSTSQSPAFEYQAIVRDHPFKAMVTAIEGCDQFCTFCVVPFTRGRERSRRAADIEAEVSGLAAAGMAEILLLGQTINAYIDPESGEGFGGLLRRVAAAAPGVRLRFVTSHPAFVDDAMISAMTETPSICRLLHVPLQAGSDRILRRMQRRYDRAGYLSMVGRLRAAMPDLVITGDIIVGFPGEEDADFEATLEMLEEVRFGGLFTFTYSARPGTAATRWPDHLSEEVKRERLARLTEIQERIQLDLNRHLIGSVQEVLVDGPSKRGDGQLTGRDRCNRIVNFDGDAEVVPGALIAVRIGQAHPYSLVGNALVRDSGRSRDFDESLDVGAP
jgi:tRNA-2-methylthio-N6-dimethylallyladenosine synthase